MLIPLIKKTVEHIPYPVGRYSAYVPFSWRLGPVYSMSCKRIAAVNSMQKEARSEYLLKQLNRIIQFAQKKIPFYRNLYGSTPLVIHTIQDFEALPVISKEQVREYTQQAQGAMLINTGGTSGEPLNFYIDRNAWAREWAHMHCIWRMRGYHQTDMMITMLGKDLGSRFYRYNAVHNEIKLNPYMNAAEATDDIVRVFKRYPIKYLQGYPSSIFNMFRELEPVLNKQQKDLIKSRIRCCFFSSEYPLQYMVDYLQNVWGLDYISWYGHSEMCVLAYDEYNTREYVPFITYGYAEDVEGVLHGTSFNNYDMPLIRYATGDRICGKKNDCGIMESFQITAGREGEFVEDRNGKELPLTALIFGRHHSVFNVADYVQLSQNEKGYVTVYIVAAENRIKVKDWAQYFDFSNIDITFNFKHLPKPIRTKGGKYRLKLTKEDVKGLV